MVERYLALVIGWVLIGALGALGGMAAWFWLRSEKRDDLDPEILEQLRQRVRKRRADAEGDELDPADPTGAGQ